MKERKRSATKRSECTKGHELIAEYMRSEADTGLTSDELRLHAKSCKNCTRLLLRLEPLVRRSLEPHILFSLGPDRETADEPHEVFAGTRRELARRDPVCRECAEVHQLIADCVSGEPNDGFPPELLIHLLSCPDCNWLMPILVQVVRAGTPALSRELPVEVRQELWVKIRCEIHTDRR